MKVAPLLLLLAWQGAARDEAPIATPQHMRYQRSISLPAGAGQTCAVLDAQIFPHAQPSLKDLRVFPLPGASSQSATSQTPPPQSGTPQTNPAQSALPREVPYALTLSETVTPDTQQARVLNLGTSTRASGSSGTNIVFDLEMPPRAYTEVTLDLAGQNFIATATVSGMDAPGSGKSTALGVFTLFDLSSQRLSRDTTLPLEESTFRYLHVALAVSPAPGTSDKGARFDPSMVEGAQVPPSREAETIYTTVAETRSIATVGRESRATFVVPTRVPLERISFVLAPGFKGNFSRDVRVTGIAQPPGKAGDAASGATAAKPIAAEDDDLRGTGAASPEAIRGTILRVRTSEAGHEINTEQLSIPAILGSNLQNPAKVQVALENGDDQPLPIAVVKLEMRQRKLCFDVPAGPATNSALTLYYGDPTLAAPVYDYDRLFTPSDKPLTATLGPELPNPDFHPPPTAVRPFTERHPEVLWIALIAVICTLGMVALKSSRNVGLQS